MEQKFLEALAASQAKATALGVRIRPITQFSQVLKCLDGHRESDGFWDLSQQGRLDLSLEALSIKKQFASLFTDEQANTALERLLNAGYTFI